MNVLVVIAFVFTASAPGGGTPRDTTMSDAGAGFAFELPRGYGVNRVPDGGGHPIRGLFEVTGKEGADFEVESEGPEYFRAFRPAPARPPGDSVLAYVRARVMEQCVADGPDGSSGPDRITSLKRYRNSKGAEVFEIVLHVVQVSWPGSGDDEDSTAVADTSTSFEPDTTYAYDFGPLFAVDLSRPGMPLVVWVRPYCGVSADGEASKLGRIISRTLRRL